MSGRPRDPIRVGRTRSRRPILPAITATVTAVVAVALTAVLLPATARAAIATHPPDVTATAAVVGGPELATTGTVVHPSTGVPALPADEAAGWVVADLSSGEVLAAHDPHGRYAPASTLKMLTADTVIPQLDPTASLTATAAEVNVDGTRVGVVPGHAYTVAMLLRGLLMVSGNDAARVLAGALGGDAAVVREMNARAAALGADDTHAGTVTGLDAAGQSSSAYDLAVIARAGLELPAFRADVGLTRVEFSGAGTAPFQISNHNRLLGRVPGVYGVKNGYTDAARASYVGVAQRGGRTIVITLIRARPDFAAEATALLDWGFAADGRIAPVGTLDTVTTSAIPDVVAPPGDRVPAAGRVARAAALPGSGHDLTYLAGGVAAGLVLVAAGRRRRRTVRRRSASRRYTSRAGR